MNGLAYNNLAHSLAEQRAADTEARARLGRLLVEAGADHPVRRRIAHALIATGLRVAPSP